MIFCLISAGNRGRLTILPGHHALHRPTLTHGVKPMGHPANRRQFLKTTPIVSAGYWVGGGIGRAATRSPNEKLNLGVIGVNGRGRDNLNSVAGENIAALCNIDENNLAAAPKQHPKAKTYVDWRKLLDQKDLDAVVVSTADQVHALASNWAMQRGLSVYCEKPLAHSVHEAHVVRQTYLANKGKLSTQMGTQIHAEANYRRVVELIQRRDRPRSQGARLVRPDRPRRRPAAGRAARPQKHPLGPLARSGPLAAVQPRLPAGQSHLEPLVGLRQRDARRHGQPHDRSALLGIETG